MFSLCSRRSHGPLLCAFCLCFHFMSFIYMWFLGRLVAGGVSTAAKCPDLDALVESSKTCLNKFDRLADLTLSGKLNSENRMSACKWVEQGPYAWSTDNMHRANGIVPTFSIIICSGFTIHYFHCIYACCCMYCLLKIFVQFHFVWSWIPVDTHVTNQLVIHTWPMQAAIVNMLVVTSFQWRQLFHRLIPFDMSAIGSNWKQNRFDFTVSQLIVFIRTSSRHTIVKNRT